MVDLAERIDALLSQEESFYKTEDYLAPEHQNELEQEDHSRASSSSSSSGINECWRNRIVEWAYQVCDHFDLSREVVSIAMNFLDRFLAKKSVDKHVFQLAAITCFHVAGKLMLEPGGKITMETMIELSRGYFSVEDMKRMELELLRYVDSNHCCCYEMLNGICISIRLHCTRGAVASAGVLVLFTLG